MGTDDFWSDDAAAVQQREVDRLSGRRMPVASVVVPPDLLGSHATASADHRAMPRKKSIVPTVFLAAVLAVGVVGLLEWNKPVVTIAEFDRLKAGMTVEECREIVGSPGAVVMRYDGPPIAKAFRTSENIQWTNRDGSKAVAGFINEKMFTKVQIGL